MLIQTKIHSEFYYSSRILRLTENIENENIEREKYRKKMKEGKYKRGKRRND
jgi:hypothetical protein